jgi:hypothetical protein
LFKNGDDIQYFKISDLLENQANKINLQISYLAKELGKSKENFPLFH